MVIANAVGRKDRDAVRKATHASITVVAGGVLAAALVVRPSRSFASAPSARGGEKPAS